MIINFLEFAEFSESSANIKKICIELAAFIEVYLAYSHMILPHLSR